MPDRRKLRRLSGMTAVFHAGMVCAGDEIAPRKPRALDKARAVKLS
jgi:hypothetical protein